MFDTVLGLPVHPLVVHATVIVIPLAALAVALAALLPRFRRWAGLLPLALSVVALVLVPVTTLSGEALKSRIGGGELVETHESLGRGLLPWVVGLVVGALLLAWADRRRRRSAARGSGGRGLVTLAVVVALVAAAGTTVQVARVGHSGATAAWSGVVQATTPG